MNADDNYQFPQMLGKYRLLKLIGKGGMGEIFLAEDPVCERKVALKKILPKLIKYPSIKRRFLSEAKIAAQLAHPSIIPIYALHVDEDQIYYTMPYIEGETLKSILKKTREQEKNGDPPHPIGSSIPALIRIFLSVCQATDYTHVNGFLHRDLKPENIMVGKFGEVTILDWGIAHRIDTRDEDDQEVEESAGSYDLTKPGKVVGTVGYMAPERAIGHPSTIKTDIYSLGVLLYQLLTLRLPFLRPSLREFRKKMQLEAWTEPQEIAPHRDIPSQLSQIAHKCVASNPDDRYGSIHEMITELEHYIEGRPAWMPTSELFLARASAWEFQENVLLAKHMAISRLSAVMEWVMLMISKESYSGNTRIEAEVTLSPNSYGIGFLMCVPDANEREGLEEGYLIWLGSKKHAACKLFRSNVEVMDIPDVGLKPNEIYHISIEKIENHFRLCLNGAPILNYISHIPLIGGHVGILSKDADYDLDKISISLGSQNVMVNCLSVPDAFLTSKDYAKALSEYRRIAHSFKGRAEGREALFRAGITLLEQAKHKKGKEKKNEYFPKALDEFEKLYGTPGAPLEYLGKSLVYKAEGDLDEEIKCLELAIRKYARHPLLPQIEEHISYRLHETARRDRRGAYSFLLLALRHLPNVLDSEETQSLMTNLTSNWEELPFIKTPASFSSLEEKYMHLAIQLAFWLSKPTVLYEITQKLSPEKPESSLLLSNALFALLEMDYLKLVEYILNQLDQKRSDPEFLLLKNYLEIATQSLSKPFERCLELFERVAPKTFSSIESRLFRFLVQKGLSVKTAKSVLPYLEKQDDPDFLPLRIWALLLAEEKREPHKLLESIPQTERENPSSPFYFLYGCFLSESKGETEGLAHFEPSFEARFPQTPALLSHFLKGNIKLKTGWYKQAFLYEKITLYRELALYYFCLGKKRKAAQFEEMIEKEQEAAQIPLNFL